MIYLIHGENAYLQELELQKITKAAGVALERIDTDGLSLNALADIVRGGSLFAMKRLVIIRELSADATLFGRLAEWAGEVPDETTIVLLERKLDKRTKAYKAIIKAVTVITVDSLTERDMRMAEEWLRTTARQYSVSLSPAQVAQMVERALVASEKASSRVVDQMQLAHAVKALAGAKEVTDEMIATVLPRAMVDSVFDMLDIAARRESARLDTLLADMARTEDGHRALALLSGQWAQLVAVATLGGASQSIATELGLHPFVAKKMQETASRFRTSEIRSLTQLIADLDIDTKTSQAGPWDAVYRFLYAITTR
jgi:DNA polymerase III subunit delta